jgi:DHA2 family multidrug resistance protein
MMYQHALQAQRMEMWGMTQVQAFQSAFGVLNQKVAAEALVYAFRDCFFIIFVWFVLVLGALALMPKPKMVQPPS